MSDKIFSDWYRDMPLRPGKRCDFHGHCADCRPSGDCDVCGTINGRDIEAVSEYASTCDWCGELAMNESKERDPQTQLGYCQTCVPKLPESVRARLLTRD